MEIPLDKVLWSSEEDNAVSVTQIVLRDDNYSNFSKQCLSELISVEAISLSHNCVENVNQFESFVQLTDLNLNHNNVSSLGEYQSSRLRRLFLANNSLETIDGIGESISNLNTLCLFGNQLKDLNKILEELGKLSKLRHLELDGNPCSVLNDEYIHKTILCLPFLKTLDGEDITPLKREMAEDYFKDNGMSIPEALQEDFSTARGTGGNYEDKSSWGSLTARSGGSSLRAVSPLMLSDPALQRGSSDELNEALASARSVLGTPSIGVTGVNAPEIPPISSSRSSFVDRLRGPSPTTNVSGRPPLPTIPPLRPLSGKNRSLHDSISTPSPRPFTANSSSSNSDAAITIKELLSKISDLEVENEQLRNDPEETYAKLKRENEQLFAENKNIFHVFDQNKELRKEVKKLNRRLDQAEMIAENDTLKLQNKELKESLENLTKRYEKLRQEYASTDSNYRRPQTAMRVLSSVNAIDELDEDEEDDDDMDYEEIEALFRRNQNSLKQIKHDLTMTKLEAGEEINENDLSNMKTSSSMSDNPYLSTKSSTSSNISSSHQHSSPSRPRTANRYLRQIEDSSSMRFNDPELAPVSSRRFSHNTSNLSSRPKTPNVLGRQITSDSDIEAAKQVIEEGNAKMAEWKRISEAAEEEARVLTARRNITKWQ